MVSLEMIGYYSAEEASQRYPVPGLEKVYGSRGDFIVLAGRLADVGLLRRIKTVMSAAASLPVHSINAPVTGVDFSDHASYWVHGYRAVMVTDTAFYRNPHYHERSDTPETLDYQRMAQVVQQVHAAVLELSR
jgi:Zn-dependent M28 family amino/carboxypeptidase